MQIIYQEQSNTLRVMPQNYLLAHNTDGHWVCDPDGAIDLEIVFATMEALSITEHKYRRGGKILATVIMDSAATRDLTEEQIIRFGMDVAYLLHAAKEKGVDCRWQTQFGGKSNLGLGRTILRLLDEVKG